MLPASLGVPWLLERQESLEWGQIQPPAPLAETGAAELAGSHWEFRGMAVGELGEVDPPPDGVELVDAVFSITPEDEVAAERLRLRCTFRAEDDSGRYWEPASGYDSRESLEGTGNSSFGSCSDPDAEALEPGEREVFVVSFLVPEDAVSSLRFVVEMNTDEVDPDAEFDLDDLDALSEWDPDAEPVDPPQPVAVAFAEPASRE